MFTSIRKVLFTFALILTTYSVALSQATVIVDQRKDACNGLLNGSVRITVTAGVGPFSYFLIGADNGSGPFTAPVTQGVPITVSNLPVDNYFLTIFDTDGANNFSTFILISNVATPLNVAVDPGYPIANTDCASPTGQIRITASGGTGSFNYAWTSTNGFTSTSEDLTSLPGGTYSVVVSDAGTNCTISLGSIVVTDPSPVVQVVTSTTPQKLCVGTDATISLGNTEGPGVTYEVQINGVPTGITKPGANGPISFTVPFASLADGNILTVRAANGACTPINMNGLVTIQIVPLPVPAIGGTSPVCSLSTGNIYTTALGQTNYVWNVTGGTVTAGGTATSNSVTVTWGAAGTGSVSVNYTTADGCTATTPTVRNITISPIPTPTINGPASRCVNSTGATYITESGQSNYVWTVSAGGTITSGAGTNTIDVTWNTVGAQTVSVNYQNAASCAAPTPTVYNVTVTPLPTPLLNGTLTVCLNDAGLTYATDPGMTAYVWTVVGGTVTTGGTATNSDVTVTWNTLAGAHTVSVNYTNPAGCAAATPTTATITVNALPTPTINGPNKVCANTTGNIYITEPAQSNYVWTVPAGGTITAGAGTDQITVTWTTAGARTVTVNYDNAAGCDATTPTTYNVTVDPLPTPVISGSAAVCAGATLEVYNTATSMTNYVWNVVGGTITAGGTATNSSVTVSWPTAGSGSVSVSFTDPNGCMPTAPTVYNVTVSPLPVPTIGGLAAVCANTTGVTYNTEAGMSNYVWTVSAGGTITAGAGTNQITVTWAAAGARTVRVNYDNAAGCDATAATILNVTVSARPTPTILGGTPTVCAGTTGVNYTTQPGMTGYVWTVSAGGTITAGAGTNNITVTWNTAGSQTITVNYNNAAGCAAATPVSRTITVNPLPVPALSGPVAQCVGSTNAIYATDPSMTGYIWTVSAGGTITSGAGTNSIQVTWNTTGPQTVSVNYTNANGCTATTATTVNVAVNPVPTPSLNGSPAECEGATGITYSTDLGQSNYVWTVSAGGTITAGAGTAQITVTWHTDGPQTVTVNYQNISGCPASAPTVLNVAINELPAPTITGSATECVGATSVPYSTQPGQSNYVWTISGGGTITSGAGTNSIEVTWNTAGPQTVSVNYENADGCDATTPTVRNVVVSPRPTPTLGGPLNPCIGAPTIIYTTDLGMTNYVWTVSAGGTVTAGGTPTSNTVMVNWTTSGPKTVSVNYTDANGCAAVTPTVLNILVSPIPTPTIGGLAAVCAGTTGVLYTTEPGMNNYVWTISAGGTITAGAGTNEVTVTWTTAGARTIRVNYQNAAGCPAPAATVYNVTVNPRPTITIGGDNDVCVGETITYTTQNARSNYQWTVSAGGTITSGAGTPSITVTWNTAGPQSVSVNYAITATGCAALTPVTRAVTVNPPPTPTILGPLTPCVSTTGIDYTTQPGMTGYVWTVSAGGTITAGGTTATATIVWSGSGAQTVTVNYTNANGCAALTPGSLAVNVNAIPTPALLGLTKVCAGTTGVTYTTDALQSNYQWSIPTGATITAGGTVTSSSVTVTWNTAGNHTVSVNYDNTSGCPASSPTVINVDVDPVPTPTITGGTATECVGESVTYITESGMANYVWTVSVGGSITSGAGTNSIDVTWNTAGARTVSVNYDNADGCDAPTATVRNITVNPLPTPTILGALTPCVSTTGIFYNTQPGMTGYVWTVSAGGTITAGATTATATIVWSGNGPQTVTVNYTDANGCAAITPGTLAVNVNAVPTPGLLGLTKVCAGTTNVTYNTDALQSNYQWSIPTGATITAGGTVTSSSVTVTWNTAGNHTVSVNYDNTSGCPASTPTVINVDVDPVPTPTITGGTATECVGESVTYLTESGMSNYVWTVSAGGTITAGTDSIDVTWNTAGARTVSVNYDNADGCDAPTATVRNITVNPLPTPTILGALTPCVSTTGILYNTQPGMTGYVWTVSAGGTITAGGTTATATIVWSGSGPQTVTVNYTDANGCAALTPGTLAVNVNAIPTPGLLGLTKVCAGTTNVTYNTDALQSNYQWSIPTGATITAGGTATSSSVTVTWNTAGGHTVSVNYDNTSGCPASAPTVINVDVDPVPTPTITGGTATECVGESVTYLTQPGMSNYVWAVSAGGTITSGAGTNSIDVTWNTAGARTVSVNYDNADGCDAPTATVRNITVNPLPTPTILGALTPCVSITGIPYNTQPGMTGYVWTVSAGGTITAGATTATATIVWSGNGAQTVTVNYTDANGCAAITPGSLAVNVNAVPTPGLLGLTEVCRGTTNVTYTTDPLQSNYQWSIPTGATITAGGTVTSSSVTVTWNTAGTHSVSVNYDNTAGCAAPTATTLSVTVDPIPTPIINGGTSNSCIGGSVTYTTQASMTNYDWDISAGGTITAGGTPTDDFVTVTWNTAGNQTVSVNYENADGCDAPTAATRTITVTAIPPAPALAGNITPCKGHPITYTTDPGKTSYVWTISAGGTITAGGTATNDFVTVNWATATAETVSVIYNDPSGCNPTAATTLNINVSDAPTPTLNGSTSECVGATSVTYDTDPGMTNYVWTVSAGGIITAGTGTNSIDVTWNTAGSQTVSVNYEGAGGCSANTATTVSVQVNAVPTPTLTGGLAAECAGKSVTYQTESSRTNYVWNVTGGTVTAGGTPTSDFITITWNTPGPQTVSVNYDNAAGCDAPTATVRTINVGTSPAPTILGLASVCTGATNVTYTTEPGMTAYDWDVLGGLIIAGGNSTNDFVTVGWPAAGNRTIRVNYTNASGCRAVASTVLTVVVGGPLVPSLGGDVNTCENETDVIYATDPAQNNYVWSITGGTITAGGTGTDNTATVTWNAAGPGTVTVNYDNTVGCPPSAATTRNVQIHGRPTPTIGGGSATECVDETVTYNTELGMTNYVWTYSAGATVTGGGTTTSNTITIKWAAAGPQSVTVTYTDPNGCSPTAATTFNFTVNTGVATPGLNGPVTACQGSTTNVYITDPSKTNYVWTISAGGTITAGGTPADDSVTITWDDAGAQSVSVTYTDTNGCPVGTPATLAVTVDPATEPDLNGDGDVCVDEAGVVFATDPGQSNYVWTVSGGGTITAGGTATDATATILWSTAGNKTVTVNYTPAAGCPTLAPTSFAVDVHALPVPTINASAPACENKSVIYTTQPSMTGYNWSQTGGAITAGGSPTDNTVTITWGTAGPGTVSVNYTDPNGCTATTAVTQNVTINPVPVPTLTGPLNPCQNEAGQEYITELGQTGYVWTVVGGTITSGGTATDNKATIKWTASGPQSVSVNYANAAGCTAPAATAIAVIVKPAPTPGISGTDTLCKGAIGEKYDTDLGNTNYIWNVTGGTVTAGGGLADATITVDWPTAGPGTVSVNYTNTDGCTAENPTVLNVTVQDTPTAIMSGSASTCIGTPASITVTLTGGGPWDIVYTDGSSNFNVNGITTSPATISVSPSIITTYSMVSVSNDCGPGTFGGSATVTVNPIPGNPATFGTDTWIGYVYNDAGDVATPLPGRINFIASKYRGFIDATDIDNMSATSTYDVATDEFDMNIAAGSIFGPNVCGTFTDNFSVRYRMTKTFAVAGIYVFNVGSDDGVRLLIDGVNVLPASAFATHTYSVAQSAGICLAAGPHNFVIEYYEQDVQSRLSFDYAEIAKPVVTPVSACINAPIPTLAASSPDTGITGFVAINWYADAALTTLVGTGNSFTPTTAQLDMTTAGTTTFYVALEFACGKTLASELDVDVVNSATITASDESICESAGVVDLTTLVTAVPAGGTFTFGGSPAISGNNFDPAGLNGTTVTITVDYTTGTCAAPQAAFDLTITNSAVVTVPTTAISTCEIGTDIDLLALVSANPAGGTFTFSGPGVSGSTFDPSGLSGNQTINVNYTGGGCAAPPQASFIINVSPTADFTANNGSACQNGGTVNLLTRVSAGTPAGGTFSFSGPGVSGATFTPASQPVGIVTITATYTVVGCSAATKTFDMNVLDPSDPACSGGGTNCFVFNAPVNTTLTKRPTCEDGDDGVFAINVSSTLGTGNIIVQLISPDGTIVTQVHAPGLFTFAGLSPANYEYKLTDQFGNVCQQPYSLPVLTTVEATASTFQDVTCFGEPTGKTTITATKSTSGMYYYSIDGGSSWSAPKASPFEISDLPPDGTYGILIGDKVNDACAASVVVIINNKFPAITATFNIDEATCSGNDGAITVNASGGNGGYEYSLDGLTFQTSKDFDGLSGGGGTVVVRDVAGCSQVLPYVITFPGYIAYDNPIVKNADCNNNGDSGEITIKLSSTTVGPNQYQVAISTDMFNEPDASQFVNYTLPNITFGSLPAGNYYAYIKAINASSTSCATRTSVIEVKGVQAISYTLEQGCQIGTGINVDKPFLFIKNIVGDVTSSPYPARFKVNVARAFPPANVMTKEIDLMVENSVVFSYDADPSFMQFPGEYVITLSQLNIDAACEVKKIFTYNVPIPLSAQIGGASRSFPEIPTGSLQVVKFFGGIPPYDVRIELDSASSLSQLSYTRNFEEVEPNSNLEYARNYKNIPAGRYIVQVMDSVGCFVQFNGRVPLDTDTFIPNIFTPNEDGVNDVFFVRNLPTGARLVITNRWGKEVYASNNYQNDWKGDGVADGIYFYRLKGSDSESKAISGWIEILRGNKP